MDSGDVLSGVRDSVFYLCFEGDVRLPWCVVLEDHCRDILSSIDINGVKVDVNSASNLDSTTLGVLAKVGMLIKQQRGFAPELYCVGEDLLRLVRSMSLDSVFHIKNTRLSDVPQCKKIQFIECEEDMVKSAVIDAHKTLMEIDDKNVEKFSDLVSTLEHDGKP